MEQGRFNSFSEQEWYQGFSELGPEIGEEELARLLAEQFERPDSPSEPEDLEAAA